MKRIIYLIIIYLILFSCANGAEKKDMINEVSVVKEIETVESFENEFRTKQKLQDYFDLLVLQQKHPEFKDEIEKQLQKIGTIYKKVTDTNAIQIKNLKLIGSIEKISDTVQKLKIVFDVKSLKKVKKDTIIAVFSTKTVQIEGKTLVSSKIKFEK